MSQLTRVRVLNERSLSLNHGEGIGAVSTLHRAGDELELPADEADVLIGDGYVEAINAGGRGRGDDALD